MDFIQFLDPPISIVERSTLAELVCLYDAGMHVLWLGAGTLGRLVAPWVLLHLDAISYCYRILLSSRLINENRSVRASRGLQYRGSGESTPDDLTALHPTS